MKSQLKILFLFTGCMVHPLLHADEPRMIVNTLSGDKVSIDLSTATRITFSPDQASMFVSGGTAGDDMTFDIDDISSIMFTFESSVDNPGRDVNGLNILSRGTLVSIAGSGPIEYAAADAAGRLHFAGHGVGIVILDFSTRPAGVYVVRANNTTFKFINR